MADFERYRSFVAVYRAGTASAAAEARFLTQPAVSQHVASLEAATGHRLFKRTPKGMTPTECGKKLYAQVAQAVDALERVAQGQRGSLGSEMPLVGLGAPREYFHELVLRGLRGAPLRFWLRFGATEDLLGELERRELNLVVATKRLPSPAVEYEKLADERFLLVGPPGLGAPAAARAAAARDARMAPLRARIYHSVAPDSDGSEADRDSRMEGWLTEQDWISYGADLPIIRRFWQQSFGRRPDVQPVLFVPDLRAILRAVELGHGISLLPDYLCREALERGRVSVLWEPPEPIENELWTVYRKADRGDEDLRQARASLGAAAGASSYPVAAGRR